MAAKHEIHHHGAEHVEHHHHRRGGIAAEARAEHETVAEERREHERKAHGGPVMRDTDMPEHERHGGSIRRPRRARGGEVKAKVNAYNAQGSPEEKEAEDETEDFKRGGHAKRKAGGMAEGHEARERGDRAHRGRHREHEKRAAGGRAGGSPLSSGRTLNAPKDDKPGRGHEGIAVPPEPFL